MNISMDALSLCAKKYNKGKLLGIRIPEFDPRVFSSEKEAKWLGDELLNSEMIEIKDESFRVSPLGQHIINMMSTPEIMIKIDNKALNLSANVYLRDAYYLSCIKRNTEIDENILSLNLLPDIKKIVELFVFALKFDDTSKYLEHCLHDGNPDTIMISGYSWDRDRKITTQMFMEADYTEQGVEYVVGNNSNDYYPVKPRGCRLSDFINMITKWMLERISENYLREERVNIRYGNQS